MMRTARGSFHRFMNCLVLLLALSLLYGCGSVRKGNSPSSQSPSVVVIPATAYIRTGDTQLFVAMAGGPLPVSPGGSKGTRPRSIASITRPDNTDVIWSVNGIAGGNATVGTIDTKGLYTAPTTLPGPSSVKVTATSSTEPSISATAAVTLENPIPMVTSVSPTMISVGSFTLTVNGSKFVRGARVLFAGTALQTVFNSATQLTAVGTATQGQLGSFQITVKNPDPGSTGSANAANLQVGAASPLSPPSGVTAAAPPGTASSITKDGITWTFSQAVPVGQFVTGDYYVVGPATVTAISPNPTTSSPYLNGSVKNLPIASGKSGFDSRLNAGSDQSWYFDATLRSYPPIELVPGDSLVSSISLAQIHSAPEVMRPSDMSWSPVRTVSVLTVLSAAPSADAFRPSYCDRHQMVYHAGALQRDLLPSLAPPSPSNTPSISQFETLYRRPWIDTNAFLFDAPAEYMPSYGQHIAFADSYASLMLMLNFPADQKVNLTNYFVQYGIDLYGCLQAGVGWPAMGGHRSGRKLPILFAGILLGNDGMKNAWLTYPNQFGEDMQTLYVNQIPLSGTYQEAWQGATVIYGGHYGVNANGQPVSAGLYGPYEQLQPSSWGLFKGSNGSEQLGEIYRRCCTSVSWVGEALAVHLLHAESIWNHPAFFDYVDRWMTEDDTQAIQDIKSQTGFDYGAAWERQGQTRYWLQGEFPQNSFIDDMWKAYR